MNLIEDMDTNPIKGQYNDLMNGMYEKTIYVKTWAGKTITVEPDLKHTMEIVRRRIEAKIKKSQAKTSILWPEGKSLRTIYRWNITVYLEKRQPN